MSNTPINVVSDHLVAGLSKLFLLETPAWTRLEPQSITGDPTPGIEARIHDPLWLLGRQWQFGEFRGEDAGTPIAVHTSMTSKRMTAWKPGDKTSSMPAQEFDYDFPLEPEVEREPSLSNGVGLRQQAEAGALLVDALVNAGFDIRSLLVSRFPLPVDAQPPEGVAPELWIVDRLWSTIAKSSPDAEAIANSIEIAGGAPDWLDPESAEAKAVVSDWLAWYRSQVSRLENKTESWVRDRLEYRFSLRAGDGADPLVFVAPSHDGGSIDWFTFDYDPESTLTVDNEVPSPDANIDNNSTVLATPLRYAGMPSDRLWQFEDGSVNFGRIDAQPHDLARLCFVEFSMIYSNDWFVVPIDLPAASFTTFKEIAYTTTFGDRFVINEADDSDRSGRFRMFGHSINGTDQMLHGLMVPPSARATLEGRSLEDVVLLRDESANMAWAVEKTVQTPSGDPRSRISEPQILPKDATLADNTDLRYTLETTVPANWIPLVPVATANDGSFVLRKGTMTDKDESLGEILDPTPLTFQEEEVPREGLRVQRVPAICRTANGDTIRWVARRVSIAQGEGASRLAFDDATKAGSVI
ncbi:hypothetical protein B0F87_11339 [Methylobacter tundripaludum]|uniref:Uncharacterized protein n=1 Tax=Methylobacter tundripaludum TaxID=173365 RepID=A0A2S6H8Y3_9GAMM|nr:hypothetical protein [Methylobacter tundripaludum]PPK73928.1 hypothetical protein B0F87_11339 [Methylobacter tundripaludum]